MVQTEGVGSRNDECLVRAGCLCASHLLATHRTIDSQPWTEAGEEHSACNNSGSASPPKPCEGASRRVPQPKPKQRRARAGQERGMHAAYRLLPKPGQTRCAVNRQPFPFVPHAQEALSRSMAACSCCFSSYRPGPTRPSPTLFGFFASVDVCLGAALASGQ